MKEQKDRVLLVRHAALYPGVEIEDIVKLLFQSEFGGGHLIEDPASFVARLAAERAQCRAGTRPAAAIEEIGGGYCRVHLAALEEGLKTETLAQLCVLSAQQNQGQAQGFLQRLKWVPGMVEEGKLPVQAAQWNHFIEEYSQQGCPPLHHSERYRALYQPHYRVLAANVARFLPVFAKVDRALGQKPHMLVGIDGMCASGKSTLAGLMEAVYGCHTVHADHFFLPPALRTAQRLGQPGGNIDYARLAPVVAMAGQGSGAFSYQPYDCQTGQLGPAQELPAAPLTLLEGSYALHPKVGAMCDLRVFLAVEAQEQARRVQVRNAPLAPRFLQEWIPMENHYFAAFSIRESCDVVVDTSVQGGAEKP